MARQHYSPEETAARGEAIYAERIRARVESEHCGEFLVVDVDSGDYEIGQDDLAATRRALASNPDAVLYGLRIGFSSAYRLGGRFAVLPS